MARRNQSNFGGRQSGRQSGQFYGGFDGFGGGYGGYEQSFENVGYLPETNDALLRSTEASISRAYGDRLGMTADHLEIDSKSLKMVIDTGGEVVRENEKVPGERLATRQDLAADSLVLGRKGKTVTVDGGFSVDVTTTLIMPTGRGSKRQERALVFKRAHIDTTKGETGPVGLLQNLPGKEIRSEIGEEHFIIGEQAGKEVLISLAGGDDRSFTATHAAKERILAGLRGQLSSTLSKPGSTAKDFAALNKRISYLQQSRPIVSLKEQALPESAKKAMRIIETKINGQTEKTEGFVHIDPTRHTLTIARPVRLDPEAQGIKIKEVLDGTGMEREVRYVTAPERSLSQATQQMLEASLRPTESIDDPAGRLMMPYHLEARLLRAPYAVSPRFDRVSTSRKSEE